MILRKIWRKLYRRGEYDCSNMSADWKWIFDKLGLDTCYVLDLPNNHVFLCIRTFNKCFESTNLRFHEMSDTGV
jgi:hypothetical protein